MVLTGRAGLTGCRAAAAAAAAAAGFMAEYIPPRWFEVVEWFSFKIDQKSFFSKKFLYYLLRFFQNGRRTQTRSMNTLNKSKWRSCMKMRCFQLQHFKPPRRFKLLFHFFYSRWQIPSRHCKRKKRRGRKKRGGYWGFLSTRAPPLYTHTRGIHTRYILYTLTHTQTLLDTQRRCPKEALNPREFLVIVLFRCVVRVSGTSRP